MDAEEKRLAMLYFRWDEVAPLLRGMYARQLDGFGQEPPQPSVKFPVFHSETVAVYPGDKNNLPYDVVAVSYTHLRFKNRQNHDSVMQILNGICKRYFSYAV